jgi:methylglutaconyl-CoA hydratase
MIHYNDVGCTKPVIARINGPALGGGWGLIFCTDIRIVHPSAYFAFAEVKRGIVPAIIRCVPFTTPLAVWELCLFGFFPCPTL